jgi:RNA polymerase sigma factor (sigma-70 family)
MPQRQRNSVLGHLRRLALRHDGAMLTDGELMERYVAARDHDAFEVLLRRHGPTVLGVCRRILGNDADAHDAFQATFLVFVRKAASVRRREAVGNWFYGVAHKTALKAKFLQRQRRAKERQAPATSDAGPADDARQELLARLDGAVVLLPDKYRAPVVLCDLEGLPLKEAARQLGCPPGTVASRLARARQLLARRLARPDLPLGGGTLALTATQGTTSAGVPADWVAAAVQLATGAAAGKAAPGAGFATVFELADKVLSAMRAAKLLAPASWLLALAVLGGGAGLLARTLPTALPEGRSPVVRQAGRARSDMEALRATWVIVHGARDGEPLSEVELRWWKRMVISGERITRGAGELQEGTFTIDPNKQPKEIDMTFAKGTLKGLYDLRGNTLTLAFAVQGRPTGFDSMAGFQFVYGKQP